MIIDYHQGRVVVTPDGRDNRIVLVTGDGEAIEDLRADRTTGEQTTSAEE